MPAHETGVRKRLADRKKERDYLEAIMLERDKQETGIGNQIFRTNPQKSNCVYRSLQKCPQVSIRRR